MPNIQNVSFQSPGFDYSGDLYALQRRQALAEALRAQAMQPIEPQQAGGLPVPISPLQGLSKIAQGATAGLAEKRIEEGQRQSAEKSRSDLADILRRGSQAMSGTPAIPPLTPNDDEGNPMPGVAAAGPDPMAAANIYMQHPTTAPLGMQQMQRQSDMQALAQALRGQPGTTPGPVPAGAPGVPGAVNLPPIGLLGAGDMGKTVFEALQKANAPINVRPGGTVYTPGQGPQFTAPQGGIQTQWGPQGPIAGLVPGAQELAARGAGMITGAQEAGRAPFQLETVQTPGAPTLMTRQQAIEGATGRPMQSPFAIPSGQVQPGSAPVARGRPGLPLQDQGQGRAQVEMGEGLGKRFNAIQDSGFNASQKINKFSRLGTLLEDINTGKLAPTGFEIAAYAKSLGIPISEKLDNAQAAKAVANDLALELRNPSGGAGMPGALSDADRNFLLSMVANLDKTPGANKLLIEGSIKLAQRDREVADLARQYKKKHGQFDEGFYDELQKYSDSRPLFTKAKPSGKVVDFNELPDGRKTP